MNPSSSNFNNFQNKLKEQRKNPETSRAGLKWEQDEDNTLIDKINENVSIEDIAKELQRTVRSIKTRLVIKAINYSQQSGATSEEAAEKFKVDVSDINSYVANKKNRAYNPSTSYNRNSNAMVTLSTIHKLLLEINSKLH